MVSLFKKERYLDNNATTTVDKRVIKVMRTVLAACYGNPSSLYQAAHRSKEVLEESRRTVAAAINAAEEEIVFTGSASEANNQALISLFEKFFPERKTIIATPIEHPSVISTLQYLASRGARVVYLPVDATGIVDRNAYVKLLDADTFLVCCMYANNETGSVQDIKSMAKAAHERGAYFLSDCVQALGKIPVDVKALGVDYATFSAHKIHGPKGVGALYFKKGVPLAPHIHGGHQEVGLRAGTESLHNIAGFAEAARAVPRLLGRTPREALLRDSFVKQLKAIKPDAVINTPEVDCLPNTINVTLPGVDNAVLIAAFNYYGIAVSAGSACSTPDNKASHVLKAIGLTDDEARQSIRVRLGDNTSKNDIDYAIGIIEKFLQGKTPKVGMIAPAFLTEQLLFDPKTYILDVRFWYDKVAIKSLPGAHEASFFTFTRYVRLLPRDRHIIVICQGGFYSPVIAYFLKRKGFAKVSFLISGMEGWKAAQPELYAKHGGKNVVHLKPRGTGALLST